MHYSAPEVFIEYTPDAGPSAVSIFDTLTHHDRVLPGAAPYRD